MIEPNRSGFLTNFPHMIEKLKKEDTFNCNLLPCLFFLHPKFLGLKIAYGFQTHFLSIKRKAMYWITPLITRYLKSKMTVSSQFDHYLYYVIHNSVVSSKILKIIVSLEQNFEKTDFYSIKLVILIIIDIGK